MALVAAGAIWGALTLHFFLWCGIGVSAYFDPRVSPLGYAATMGLVWPAIGLLCILGEGLVEGVRIIGRSVTAILGGRTA